jgi:O-antigen/teichoic acid export membrane protein
MIERLNIYKSFFHTLFLSNISRVLLLLSGIVIARSLGPDGRGDIAMIIATISIISVFGSIVNGANEILMGEDNGRQNLLVRQTIQWSGLLSLFVTIIIFSVPETTLIYIFGPSNDKLHYLFPFLFFVFVAEDGIRRILLAKQDFKYINNVQTLSVVFYVFFIVFFIGVFDFKVFVAILVYIMQQLFCVAVYLVRVASMQNSQIRKPLKGLLKKAIPIGTRSILLGVPTLLLLQSDILLIKYFTNSSSVGLYQVSVSISMLVLMISKIFSTIIRSKAVSERGGHNSVLLIAKLYAVFAILIVILFYFFGETLVLFLFGSDFSDSYLPALILFIGNIFWGYGDTLVGYIVAKNKYPIFISIGFGFALIVNIVLNVLFIPVYGFIVAAWSSLISYIIVSMVCGYKFKSIANFSVKEIISINKDDINAIRTILRRSSKSN